MRTQIGFCGKSPCADFVTVDCGIEMFFDLHQEDTLAETIVRASYHPFMQQLPAHPGLLHVTVPASCRATCLAP